jgi:hypothetical protein
MASMDAERRSLFISNRLHLYSAENAPVRPAEIDGGELFDADAKIAPNVRELIFL